MNKLFASAVLLILSGCSSSSNVPVLPDSREVQSIEYLIGAGDQLNIFVWRNPDLSSNVTVRPDGRISSPLIDDLDVSGKTALQAADNIESILSAYIRSPKVTVIVSGFNGSIGQKIRVIGNAANPKSLPYREGMTLLDVMIAVQGLTKFADGDNSRLIRKEQGQSKEYRIELESLVKGGDISKNRLVYPGDTIIIPESWF